MKKIVFALALFAVAPAMAEVSIVGDWKVVGIECSSGATPKTDVDLKRDNLMVSFAQDMTFHSDFNINACMYTTKGTYTLVDTLLTLTAKEYQTCKMSQPIPVDIKMEYEVADLKDISMTAKYSGKEAALACPAGDALVYKFERQPATPPANHGE